MENIPGLLVPGNIDLHSRPVVIFPGGGWGTVRTLGITTNQGEVLIPTIGPNGEDWTEKQAIDNYYKTGHHLGIFDNIENSNNYGRRLHEAQELEYKDAYLKKPQDMKFTKSLLQRLSGR